MNPSPSTVDDLLAEDCVFTNHHGEGSPLPECFGAPKACRCDNYPCPCESDCWCSTFDRVKVEAMAYRRADAEPEDWTDYDPPVTICDGLGLSPGDAIPACPSVSRCNGGDDPGPGCPEE